MIQYRITFIGPAGPPPPPYCSSGGDLAIVLEDGIPKYDNEIIELIEVYVSGADAGPFVIVADDGRVDDYIESLSYRSVPGADRGGCSWWHDEAGALRFQFELPAIYGTCQMWMFVPYTPPVKLTVKIKRQQDANPGPCTTWPTIVTDPPT